MDSNAAQTEFEIDLLKQSVGDKAGGKRVLERGVRAMSKGAGSGRGADQNPQRPGSRQAGTRGAEAEDVLQDTAG